ncbi:MAG TPA: VIT1/CCC1 transporter family protein [Candidatus Saccharimonadales bacterium]
MSLIKRRLRLPFGRQLFAALLSGSEGGLATTTAITAGLLISTDQPDLVVLTATISFLVQAFNGSMGRFSAEHTDQELDQRRKWFDYGGPIRDALTQFVSHVLMSVIVLLPIVVVADVGRALTYAVALTLFFLFLIGAFKGRLVKNSPLRDGIEMVLVGSLIISVGIVAGFALRT